MKKRIILVATLLLSMGAFAQAPQKMSYQSVVRDANQSLVANQSVSTRISILQGSSTGTAVFVEEHSQSTNVNGLLSLEIGNGSVVSGDFSTIDWSNGPYFIQTETDPLGGTNYSIMGVSQMASVPYALYAENSGTPGPAGNDGIDGVDGLSAYEIWINAGNTGTEADFLNSLVGAQGPTGNDGANGIDGLSAYEIWINSGNTGTETDFLNSLVGAQGPTGNDGANGIDGLSAYEIWINAGNTGTEADFLNSLVGATGLQGPAGNDGLDGATGPMGPQGPAGNDGLDGATGPMGPQGPQGPAGNDGLDGATGPMGPQGPQGPAGNDGLDGATGPMGPQGPAGNDGANGIDGLSAYEIWINAGNTGTEADFLNSLVGATGLQGPAGNDGLDGATGPMGPQGPAGNEGLDGATGPMGPQGPAGNDGANGIDGLSAYEIWINAGNTGTEADFLNSLVGATGVQGPAGNDGLDGATGPMGPQGPAGNDGLDGATGPMGPQGPAGNDGLDGATGPMGPQGPQGPAGPIAGVNKQINFNDSGNAGADAEFLYDKTTNHMVIGTSTINPNAALEVNSTTGGILFPRMTTAQRDALTGQDGLVIFNSTEKKLQAFLSGGNYSEGNSVGVSFGYSDNTQGNTFEIANTATLNGISVSIANPSGNPITGTTVYTMKVYDSQGGSLLATSTNTFSATPGGYTGGVFDFTASNLSLNGNTSYYFEVTSDNGSNFYLYASYSNNYTLGSMYVNGAFNANADIRFTVTSSSPNEWVNLH